MAKSIGIIAEDKTDVEIIKILIGKVVTANRFSTRHFVGNGCGKLRKKCCAWTEHLLSNGCHHVVIVHDADTSNASKIAALRSSLEKLIKPNTSPTAIVIVPIQEIEAWLLADKNAIVKTFGMRANVNIESNTEGIESPKEYIGRLVRRNTNRRYVTSIHNVKIAKAAKLGSLNKCESFKQLSSHLKIIFKRTR